MKKMTSNFIAFLQAAGVAVYVSLFSTLVQTLAPIMEPRMVHPLISMALFLTAFVFSALICALSVFGYPTYLFFEGKRKLAIELVLKSALWLGIFVIIFFVLAFYSSM